MGGIISQLAYVLHVVRSSIAQYDSVRRRVALSPGIPLLPRTTGSNSSPQTLPPYWTIPSSPIARHGESVRLPNDEVDVVIIGSGITGTAIAKMLLDSAPGRNEGPDPKTTRRAIRVVMLEARDACSGSTGRNGGHIGPIVYNEYVELREKFGVSAAHEILRFRLAHVPCLISTAREEGLLPASQAREVEGYDVYAHPRMFEQAKEELKEFLKEAPADLTRGFELVDGPQDIARLQLSPSTLGCISKPGGAIHPYRFVTGVLSNMLKTYSNFELFTRTPCTEVTSSDVGYLVRTPRGDIRSRHVIHATNAWTSHLLPGMRSKIVPTRATMTAQRPGKGLDISWAGSRAFVFYPIDNASVFEYLTQLLPSPMPGGELGTGGSPLPSTGEFLFGGRVQPSFTHNIGITDDCSAVFENEAHLGGALERAFAPYWGGEGHDTDNIPSVDPGDAQPPWGRGRIKAAWSGLLGMSTDLQPWVGRVPYAASGRTEPRSAITGESEYRQEMAPPGEWICAGYTGEGMVHAWLCGRALACMILGIPPEGNGERSVPSPFLISERRVLKTRLEDTLARW